MNPQRITMITLAVKDIEVSRKFYAALGFAESAGGNEKIAFYKMNGQFFSLYSRDGLCKDLSMPIHGRGTGNATLATNYDSRDAVDAAFQIAVKAGAIIVAEPTEVFWGGYSGNYTDPDGHLWEVTHNPFWSFDADGNLIGDA